jgi:hypothetical protein
LTANAANAAKVVNATKVTKDKEIVLVCNGVVGSIVREFDKQPHESFVVITKNNVGEIVKVEMNGSESVFTPEMSNGGVRPYKQLLVKNDSIVLLSAGASTNIEQEIKNTGEFSFNLYVGNVRGRCVAQEKVF